MFQHLDSVHSVYQGDRPRPMTQLAQLLSLRVALSSTLWLGSCSLLVDADKEQCQSDEECVSAGLGNTCVRNICQGSVAAACSVFSDCSTDAPVCVAEECNSVRDAFFCAAETPAEAATVKYSFSVRQFIEREKAPADVFVKACRVSDTDCTQQSAVATFRDETGSGDVELEVVKGLPVYFEVQSSGATVRTFDTGNATVDRTLEHVLVPTEAEVALLAALAGVSFDFEKSGLALIEAIDCSGQPASGLTFTESTNQGLPFVFINHQPSGTERVTQYDPQYGRAFAGFVGISGFVIFNGRWAQTGELLDRGGGSSINAYVAPHMVTFVELRLYSE